MTTQAGNRGTPTNYELILAKIPSENTLEPTKAVTLAIYGSLIPGLTNQIINTHWMGSGLEFDGPLKYDDWSFKYIVDNQFENWKILHDWIVFTNNKRNKFGEDPEIYLVDAILKVMDNYNSPLYYLKFKNCWLKDLGSVELSQREGDRILESSATLSFDYFTVEAAS